MNIFNRSAVVSICVGMGLVYNSLSAYAIESDILQQIQGAVTKVVASASSGAISVSATPSAISNYALKDKLTAFSIHVSAKGYDSELLQGPNPIIYSVVTNGYTREQVRNAYGRGYVSDLLKEPDAILKSWVTLVPLFLSGTKASTGDIAVAATPIIFRTMNRATLLFKKEDRNIDSDSQVTTKLNDAPLPRLGFELSPIPYPDYLALKSGTAPEAIDSAVEKPLLNQWNRLLTEGIVTDQRIRIDQCPSDNACSLAPIDYKAYLLLKSGRAPEEISEMTGVSVLALSNWKVALSTRTVSESDLVISFNKVAAGTPRIISGHPPATYQALKMLQSGSSPRRVRWTTGLRYPLLKEWKRQLDQGATPEEILNIASNWQPLSREFRLYVPKGNPLTVTVTYLKTDYAKTKSALTLLQVGLGEAEISKATGLNQQLIAVWKKRITDAGNLKVAALVAGTPADIQALAKQTGEAVEQENILKAYSKTAGTYESETYRFDENGSPK